MGKRICLIVMLFLVIKIQAQDSNYWNIQYGTRSTLLGGAVIGSVSDMAATFYNPAALGLFDSPEILLSGKVYQYDALTLKNVSASNADLTSSTIEAAPTLFAGSFTFKWLKKHKLSYSFMTRQRMNFGIEGQQGTVKEVMDGEELLAGELTADQRLSDDWAGLTWSYPLTPQIAVGVTQYLSIRSQKTRNQLLAQSLNPAGDVASSIVLRQFDYKVFNLLWKAGFGMNFDPLTLGVTITTPGIKITGNGSSLVDVAVSGIKANGDTLNDPVFITNFQQDVPAQFHLPLAAGGGFSYRLGKSRLHFSVEWYNAVNKFNVLETEDFIAQSSGDTAANIVDHELQSVVNYGVGLEILFKERLSGYASFVTDFSAAVPGTQTNLAVSFWDIYHLSGGVAFEIGRSEFTLGLNYSYGNDRLQRTVEYPDADADSRINELLKNAELSYKRLKLLIGFSVQI